MNKSLTFIPLNLADFKKYTQTFRTKLEQIEYLVENKLVVQNELEQNKNIGGNNNALMLEMVDYAENEIKKLGGKPEKWIEYPLVTNVHDFNARKESMKDEGRLLEWVKWLLNNVEPPVEENEGIKKDLGWSYNDRVLRQAKLDCIEQGKEYVVQKWDASNLDDDFVDHLERQLNTNTDLLPSPPENKHASVSMYPAPPENKIFETFEGKNSSKRKGEKEEHTLVFLEALKDCDEKLKKESTSNDIWTHLKEHLRSKYDPNEEIISKMHHYEMIIIKSSGNDESLDKESFARAIRRLRKDTHS